MRKMMFFILLFFILMPFVVYAETCDQDKVLISSFSLEEKAGSVEEVDDAIANGKNINLNLSMSEVGDNIKYKFVIKNGSNDDYELGKNSFDINSDYFDYVLEAEDESNILKANSSKTMYLKINYNNEIPEEKFETGTFYDNQSVTVNLLSGDFNLANPNTEGQFFLLIIGVVILVCLMIFIILKNKKYVKYMLLIMGLSLIIPFRVFAICKVEIKLESNIHVKAPFTGAVNRGTAMEISNGQKLQRKGYWEMNAWGNTYSYETREECMSNLPPSTFECIYRDNFYFGETVSQSPYLKHDIEKNVVKKTYVCFKEESEEYCIPGGEDYNYDYEKQLLINKYGESGCTDYVESIYCRSTSDMRISINNEGKIFIRFGACGANCSITSDGVSYCNAGMMVC